MKTALQFSGGKDSLACLYLYREQWETLYVLWVNTGAAYPDVVEYMDGWRRRLPNFIEIKSDQPAQIKANGYPADVVPVRYTLLGQRLGMAPPFLIQDWGGCCGANIWQPMYDTVKRLGIERLIRGQRADEKRKGPLLNGQVVEGIEVVHPLEDWTAGQVFAYLKEVKAYIPPYYDTEQTSRDCWDCTAYLDENRERIANLAPERRELVRRRLRLIHNAVEKESQCMVQA